MLHVPRIALPSLLPVPVALFVKVNALLLARTADHMSNQ